MFFSSRILGYMYITMKNLVYMLLMLNLPPDMKNVGELNCGEDRNDSWPRGNGLSGNLGI